jgi:hypothetical protein
MKLMSDPTQTTSERPDISALYARLLQIEVERRALMAQIRSLDGEARSINARCRKLEDAESV